MSYKSYRWYCKILVILVISSWGMVEAILLPHHITVIVSDNNYTMSWALEFPVLQLPLYKLIFYVPINGWFKPQVEVQVYFKPRDRTALIMYNIE